MNTLLTILAIVLAGPLFVGSLINWRLGFFGLLIFLPFAGFVSLRFGASAVTLLAKDILFVIPLYIGFFLFKRQSRASARVSGILIAAIVMLSVLAAAQAFNPSIPNMLVAFIGIKVWFLYIPLTFIAAAAINSEDDLIRLLRILTVVACVSLTFGLLQRVGVGLIGTETTASLFYGENFNTADFKIFADFDNYGDAAGGTWYRINSTFSSTGQYYTYTLTMIPVTYALAQIDRVRAWQLFAWAMIMISVVAAFLSGARGAALFVPIVFAPILILGRRPAIVVIWGALISLAYVASLYLTGIDFNLVLDETLGRAVGYSQEYAWDKIAYALSEYPFGLGTGMNTNAARYGFSVAAREMDFVAVESYYVKAIAEFGFFGLIPVLIILFAPVIRAASLSRFGQSGFIKQCAAALLGFFLMVAILSIRAWPLDVDPVNVMFWVFAGVLYKLPSIMPATRAGVKTVPQMVRPFLSSAMHAD